MPENKRDEHERLQQKTEELKQDHADLSLDVTPFNQADHDEHSEKLRRHKEDLATHKAREDDPKVA